MIVVTTDFVSGHQISETIGVARGSTIRAKHVGKDILATFRMLIGGELKEYSEMFVEARNEAQNRMIDHAKKLNADAIVGVRYTTSQVAAGAAELLVYGTAVRLEPAG